jgi:phosphonate transport system substrate-binding protein
MLTRRILLGLAAAATLTATLTAPGLAQSWKAKYPELVFSIAPAENATSMTERWSPFIAYLTKELGTKVTLRIVNDYAAVIEGQRAGNIHIAQYGSSAYARAWSTGSKIEPFAIEVNRDGTTDYSSVFYVKKESPYQKIEDLKGRNLGLVDPNSTSGNNVPRFALDKLKIDPEKFFGKVVYAGSHENAIIALQQGVVDVAATWWNDEKESNLFWMASKKMINYDDYRMIFKSDAIVNAPFVYLADLPDDLKSAIRAAFLSVAEKDKPLYEKLYNVNQPAWRPVTHKAYEPIVALNAFVDALRRKTSP